MGGSEADDGDPYVQCGRSTVQAVSDVGEDDSTQGFGLTEEQRNVHNHPSPQCQEEGEPAFGDFDFGREGAVTTRKRKSFVILLLWRIDTVGMVFNCKSSKSRTSATVVSVVLLILIHL